MRLVPISNIKSDEVLAKNILNDNGQILLSAGVALSSSLIKRLDQLGIPYVYIEDERTDDIIIEDIIKEETRRKALQKVNQTMNKLFDQQKSKSKLSSPTLAKDFNLLFDSIIRDLQSNKQIMYHMVNIHQKDDYLYHHSVNVGILSAAIGISLGYNNNDIKELGIGAMLHDIGKTQIPMSVLNKPASLNAEEYEEMKKHPEYGFKILKEQPGISLRVAHVALQHHERYNGSGYPRKICKDEQSEFAKIVAIADVYDALTSTRIYRPSYLPHEAFELILGSGDYHFDHKIIRKFSESIAIYPIGMTVKINTGEVGVVSKIEPDYPQRPTIRILTDHNGRDLEMPYEINLLENHTILITSTAATSVAG